MKTLWLGLKHTGSCLPDLLAEVHVYPDEHMVVLRVKAFDSVLIADVITAQLPEHGVRAFRDDRRQNCNVDLATERLHELVPLLRFVGCTVERIDAERTILSVPLMPAAMNQNGTHQAAVFYLVADYTLGIGMFGALPGAYVAGVHDRCEALPVQYWLKKGQVNHLAPGTGTLTAEVSITKESAAALRAQLIARGRGELSEIVRFHQDGTLVAETEHTMGIYADVPRCAGVRANLFQVQNLKTSALMIAGLREDDLSQRLARDQGQAIANRMALAAPQLPSLVKARTLHLSRYLETRITEIEQVLVLGVGLDVRPVTHSQANQRWYGLDLKEMLKERDKRFAQLAVTPVNFVPVAADLRLETWTDQILEAGFDVEASTLVILEGYRCTCLLLSSLDCFANLDQSCNHRKVESGWTM